LVCCTESSSIATDTAQKSDKKFYLAGGCAGVDALSLARVLIESFHIDFRFYTSLGLNQRNSSRSLNPGVV